MNGSSIKGKWIWPMQLSNNAHWVSPSYEHQKIRSSLAFREVGNTTTTIVLPSLKGSDTVGEMMQLMIPQKRSKRNGPGGLQLDEEGNLRVRVIITWPENSKKNNILYVFKAWKFLLFLCDFFFILECLVEVKDIFV